MQPIYPDATVRRPTTVRPARRRPSPAGRRRPPRGRPPRSPSCVSQRPPAEPSSTRRYATWSGTSSSGQTARAEHLDEPRARCERVCHRARRIGRVRMDPADGEVDRPTLLHGMREPGRERRVVAVVELHRGDAGAEVGGPPGDRRDRTAARRERAGEAGEHAGAADDDGVPGPLERCERAAACRRRPAGPPAARAPRGSRRGARARLPRRVARAREGATAGTRREAGFAEREPLRRLPSARSAPGVTSGASTGRATTTSCLRPAQAGDEPVHGSARRGAVVEHGERQPVLRPCRRRAPRRRPRPAAARRARRASRRETGRAPSATRSARTHRPPGGRR